MKREWRIVIEDKARADGFDEPVGVVVKIQYVPSNSKHELTDTLFPDSAPQDVNTRLYTYAELERQGWNSTYRNESDLTDRFIGTVYHTSQQFIYGLLGEPK